MRTKGAGVFIIFFFFRFALLSPFLLLPVYHGIGAAPKGATEASRQRFYQAPFASAVANRDPTLSLWCILKPTSKANNI